MLRTLLALILISQVPILAQDARVRPRCTAKLRASFWPPEANTDAQLGHRLAREGTLEMCTLVGWRYKWSPLTINVKSAIRSEHEKSSTRSEIVTNDDDSARR